MGPQDQIFRNEDLLPPYQFPGRQIFRAFRARMPVVTAISVARVLPFGSSFRVHVGL